MDSQLHKLIDFFYGNIEGFNGDGTFIADSEAHKTAIEIGVPVVELKLDGPYQTSLLDPEPEKCFEMDHFKLSDAPPFDFGGEKIELDNNTDYPNPVGYDSELVAIQCPRGICLITRDYWNKGRRYCDGC